MNGLCTVREMDQARASAVAPLSTANVGMTLEVDDGQGIDVRFTAPRRRRIDLERSAEESLEETCARLLPALHRRLTVEAGEVRSWLRRGGEERPLYASAYTLAVCRGAVLGISDGRSREPFSVPWTGTVAAGEIDPSLPVVLGPSAALALISFALEVTGGHVSARDAAIPGVTVTDTASSPYPPQHHPFEEDGTASQDRTLIEEGSWRNREEHAGDAVDPLFFLLTRPERALSPLAASTQFNRRNLTVRCDRALPLPLPAVLIESWYARTAPRGGGIPSHAELTYAAPDGGRLAVAAPVGLLFDPWEVLARVQGACAPAAPAVDEDPIEGNGYGLAPSLLTGLCLADLAAPGKTA